jgi:hypothetical protein
MMECPEQRPAEMIGFLEKAIMGGMLARVIPNPFRGVEFRPVGRKLKDLDVTPVLGEPLVSLLLFVVGGVVLNQEHSVSPPIKRGHQHLIQKRHIRFPLEVILLVEVDKLRRVQPNGPKNLLRVALTPGGNLGLAAHSSPSRMQSRRLAEGRLVLKDDYRSFGTGFFLRRGYA